MSSLSDALQNLGGYIAAVTANAAAANAADRCAELISAAGLGSCTVDVSWMAGEGATIRCSGRIDREAEIRKIMHESAEADGLTLTTPERRDGLKTYGSISVDYGPLKLQLSPDGATCKRVKVGTKIVPQREEPVYEIVCDEPETAEVAP